MRYAAQLCPAPWRVPSRQDFMILDMALNGGTGEQRTGELNGVSLEDQLAKFIGSSGTGSAAENHGGTWGGSRFTSYTTNLTIANSYYWSSEESNINRVYGLTLLANNIYTQNNSLQQRTGCALRCVKNGSCTAAAITAPPSSTDPASRTQNSGDFAVLSVTATGTAPLSYQWFSNSANSNSGGMAVGTGGTGATFAPPLTVRSSSPPAHVR